MIEFPIRILNQAMSAVFFLSYSVFNTGDLTAFFRHAITTTWQSARMGLRSC